MEEKILRIIDVNLNRVREGLRVCEEICRFILEEEAYIKILKDMRHKCSASAAKLGQEHLMSLRNSENDQGKDINPSTEFKRENIKDIFLANASRVKESLRVLEEFSKLKDKQVSLDFKNIRFEFYEMEVKIFERL